jgi:hypothetical protein
LLFQAVSLTAKTPFCFFRAFRQLRKPRFAFSRHFADRENLFLFFQAVAPTAKAGITFFSVQTINNAI